MTATPRSTLERSGPEDQDRYWARLLQAIARGDEQAFADFYDQTGALVYGILTHILGQGGSAEEVTSDVYLQVWRTAQRFDSSRGGARAWICTIARTRAIDKIRSENRHRSQPVEDLTSLAAPGPGPDDISNTAILQYHVRGALAALSPEQRQCLLLAYFTGMTQTEIADRLRIPLGTVKTRTRQGLLRMRGELRRLEVAI